MSLLAQRYAQALYNAAIASAGTLEILRGDLADLEKMHEQSPDLENIFNTPLLSIDKKTTFLESFVKKAEFSLFTARFLEVLNQQKRLDKISLILKAFHQIDHSTSSSVTVRVTTAYPLFSAQQKRLKAVLKCKLSREVILEEISNPHLLGGMIVDVGNHRFDATLQTRLQTLDHILRGLS